MAVYFRRTWLTSLKHVKLCTRTVSFSARRYFLSEAYSCQEAWKERLNSEYMRKVELNNFAVQLRAKFDQSQTASLVDVDILANKLQDMELVDAEYMEDILKRYRQSHIAAPVNEAIVYAIVRAYIQLDLTDRLVELIKNKLEYGIFPNDHATSYLMDYLLKKNDYYDAAHMAYEQMLQEDFSHPIVYLLSLYSCIKHYPNIKLDPPVEPEASPDEEENWVQVGVIRYLVYDDHFDIRDERFLMGKTLYMLGQNCSENKVLARSLQFMGLGLYQKFEKGIQLLQKWEESTDSTLVLEESIVKFEESLDKAETRDPEEPEKELGLITMEDRIRQIRITPEEKQLYKQQLEELKQKIKERTSTDNLQTIVENIVTSNISQNEAKDIATQTELFSKWIEERNALIKEQIWDYTQKQKEKEIIARLKAIQNKEEMLRFFENRDQIIMAKHKAPKIKGEQSDNASASK